MGLPPAEDPGVRFEEAARWNNVSCTSRHHDDIAAAQSVASGTLKYNFKRTQTVVSSKVSGRFGVEEAGWRNQVAEFVMSNTFQNITLFIIVLNGLWIGVDIEWNHQNLKKNDKLPLEPWSVIVENLFCTYFTLEILVRFVAYEHWKFIVKDMWFIFDGVLVLLMVTETWILAIFEALVSSGGSGGLLSQFSVLRLLRLARLSRIMSSLPELQTLVKGIINAARAVCTVLCFMILIMFVFAIVFTGQLGDADAPERSQSQEYWDRGSDPTGQELFGSMGDSMMTLFTRGILGDNLAETLEAIKDRGGKWQCNDPAKSPDECRGDGSVLVMYLFIIFMIISAFVLLNMLVGILCEVITETAKEGDEQNVVEGLRDNLEESFLHMHGGDMVVTQQEFARMKTEAPVRKSFIALGIEDAHIDDRLEQIEENLFGGMNKEQMTEYHIDAVPGATTRTPQAEDLPEDDDELKECLGKDKHDCEVASNGAHGFSLKDFIDRILEIRPDAPASFLDIEILRVRAERDEKKFNVQLDGIEDALRKLKSRTISSSPSQEKPRVTPFPGSGSKHAEPIANGVSGSWLQRLSTEALFAELESRAAQKPKTNKARGGAMKVD